MRLAKHLTVSAAGLSMVGLVGVVDNLVSRPATDVTEVKECVSRTFTENSFTVLSSSATRYEGRVAGWRPVGPKIAVIFNADHDGRIVFEKSALVLPLSNNSLSAIQTLMDRISDQCLRRASYD